MINSLCKKLPELPKDIILKFLDYRNRNGKYIKRLRKDLDIYIKLSKRPKVEVYNFSEDYHPVTITEIIDGDDIYYIDDEGNNKFLTVSIVTQEYGRGRESYEDRLEISYCYNDYTAFVIRKYKYIQTHPDYWVLLEEIHEDIYRQNHT